MEGINYQLLAHALLSEQGTALKAVSSTPATNVYGHGNGGLFSAPGLSQPVLSAMMMPRLGLQSELPAYPSTETHPLYGIITGVTATSGSEPTGVCDDPPMLGLMKMCMTSYVTGRQSRMTQVYDLDRFSQQTTNRGEMRDFRLLGNPLQDRNQNIPTLPGMAGAGNALNNEIAKILFQFAVAWGRDFAREIYTGDPVNNTAGGGRKYYYGLDKLINTGYRDAETGIACPAADSIVLSMNYAEVSSNGAQYVGWITNIYRRLKHIAVRTGLDPVEWAIVMPWGLFYALSEIWPCAYLTSGCATASPAGTEARVNIDAARQVAMRDEMRGDMWARTGQYLMIDSERVRVIIDDGIVESEPGSGRFRSTIYFVPLSVLGGTKVTYFEYMDYSAPNGAMDAARILAPGDSYSVSDSGRFFWHKKPPTNFCVQMLAKTEPRLILRAPFLAARLQHVQYTPLMHERSPFTDSGYFVDGGKTDRVGYGPSWYSPTA